MAKDFILVTDTDGCDHIISVSHIARVYEWQWYSSVDRIHYPRFSIDVAGALDGLSCGARIDITKELYNKLKSELL